jgi:hypothetical protein
VSQAIPAPPTAFSQLFPQPTGQNGYEDIVVAGDLIQNNTLLAAAEQPNATLAHMRAALADPACRRALALMRRGLTKPMQSPRTRIDFITAFPDLALLRNLARLIKIEQYVFLSEGRTTAAIQCLRDALRLGEAVRGETIISGLTALLTESILLYPLCIRKEQWTEADCKRLLQISQNYLAQTDGGRAALEGERRSTLAGMERLLADFESSESEYRFGEGGKEGETGLLKQEWVTLKQDAAAREKFAAELRRRINNKFDEAIAANPLSLTPVAVQSPDRTLMGTLSGVLLPELRLVRRRYVNRMIQFQLLGVHAGIQRFRWQHNRLPASLNEINLKELVGDPFSGELLQYRLTGSDTYSLSSIGPVHAPTEGEIRDDKRRDPIFLPPLSVVSR